MSMENNDWSSLSTLTLIVVVLFVSFVGWLILSSCLGIPISRVFSGVWDTTVAGEGAYGIRGAITRRRRELGGSGGDDWEMETRRPA